MADTNIFTRRYNYNILINIFCNLECSDKSVVQLLIIE